MAHPGRVIQKLLKKSRERHWDYGRFVHEIEDHPRPVRPMPKRQGMIFEFDAIEDRRQLETA
jgi:hypothetical protein